MKPSPKKVFLVVSLIALAFVLDQGTKIAAQKYLIGQGTVEVVGNVFVLRYALNPGAFLGFGKMLPDFLRYLFLSIIPAILLGFGSFYIIKYPSLMKIQVIAGALFLGGGWGNIFDRLFRPEGMVIDFMNFGIGTGWFRTGILNVADLFLFFGAIVFLAAPYIAKRKHPDKNQDDTDDKKDI